jgi:hypothetical protein
MINSELSSGNSNFGKFRYSSFKTSQRFLTKPVVVAGHGATSL